MTTIPYRGTAMQQLEELYPESIVLDGFEACILGVDPYTSQVIYNRERMIDHLMDDGGSRDDALDYIDYNILRLPIAEEKRPILITILGDI